MWAASDERIAKKEGISQRFDSLFWSWKSLELTKLAKSEGVDVDELKNIFIESIYDGCDDHYEFLESY